MVPQLGDKIRKLRLQLGVTQEQLVGGIATKSTLSQIESGKTLPSIDLLLQIADRLHIGIEELLTDFPMQRKSAELIKIADHLFRKGNFASAMRFYQNWRQLDSESDNNAAIMLKIGICYQETGQIEKAVHLLERVQQMAALQHDCVTRYLTLDHLGKLYYDTGNYHLALHYWLRALERKPAPDQLDGELVWRLLNRIGVAYFELGEHQTAIDHFYEALDWIQGDEFVSQRAISMINVASCLKYLQQYERAAEMYRLLRQEETELEPLLFSIVRLHYGVYLAAIGRYSQALTVFYEARCKFAELNEGACMNQVDNELADVYRRIGEFDKSTEILQRLLGQLLPDDIEYAQAQLTMGLLLSDQGQREAAMASLQRALQLFEAQGRTGQVRLMQEIISEFLQAVTHPDNQYRS